MSDDPGMQPYSGPAGYKKNTESVIIGMLECVRTLEWEIVHLRALVEELNKKRLERISKRKE
jgi:hypothetical protein